MARRILACPTFSSGWPLWVSRLERKKLHGSLAASFPLRTCPKNVSLFGKVNGVQKRGKARVGAKRVVSLSLIT